MQIYYLETFIFIIYVCELLCRLGNSLQEVGLGVKRGSRSIIH